MLPMSNAEFRAPRPLAGFYARAEIPVTDNMPAPRECFAAPLAAFLQREGLGRLTGARLAVGTEGRVLVLTLALRDEAPATLLRIARHLAARGAPAGARIGNAECPDLLRFGGAGAELLPAGWSAPAPGEALRRLEAVLARAFAPPPHRLH